MGYINESLNPRSVIRKILAAFLLAFVAVVLAQSISRFSFRELLGTVEELSEPNEKLALLNSVFHEITTLDQMQRAEAITNPNKPYNSFLNQSANLTMLIDSLVTMASDTGQLERLVQMKDVLNERNKLFFSYLKVKAEILDNRKFSTQLDTLASILTNDQMAIDSSLITTQKRTITTYLPDTNRLKKKEHRSFFRQLFSKKSKDEVDTPTIKVEEHFSVDFDTLAVARQNEALLEVERIMRELETEQRNQRKRLEHQELELIQANSRFISQLLNILHDVENEELELMRLTNSHAVSVMNQSIARTNLLLLIFLLAAAFFVYLIYIDVTRSNYYKAQLEQARDKAEELSQIKQRFLANMSHEIRTPLQSIIGFAEQLKHRSGAEREAAEAIHSSSEHLLHIVNEVLDYSRISSGNFTLEREPFTLIPLVKEVEAAMRMQAEGKGLTFMLDAEQASDATLLGDPFRLRQILYNLLGNAIKFTSRGFVKLTVKTTEENRNVECAFEIADTGIGIFPDDLEKIFNQFEQANPNITKQFGGTGLGLTIVKSLVDAQKGSLDVTSKPGSGSTFVVRLPFERSVEEVAAPTTTEDEEVVHFAGKIIVVDDDPLILRLCSLILSKNNIEHTTFHDPRACLSAPVDPNVTHILLDIRMPAMNGIELCQRLRGKYREGVRFIALTAHVLKEERESIRSEGFDSILSKPFHEADLLGLLNLPTPTRVKIDLVMPNLTALREMTLNDEALFQSVVSQFIEETSEDVSKLKIVAADEDTKGTREIVHRLAGRLNQIGVRALGARFSEIEGRIVSGQVVPEFEEDLQESVHHLEQLIGQLRLTTLEHLN